MRVIGNLGCYAADGNDNCPSLCPNADRVAVWRVYPGKLTDPQNDGLYDRILLKDDSEYFYQIVYSSNNYYIENFGRGGYKIKVP